MGSGTIAADIMSAKVIYILTTFSLYVHSRLEICLWNVFYWLHVGTYPINVAMSNYVQSSGNG